MQLNISHIHSDNCFKPPKQLNPLSIHDCRVPWFWVSKLKSELDRRNMDFVSELDKHTRYFNSYKYSSDLYRSLQMMYAVLTDCYKDPDNPPITVTEGQKQAIATKISEGLPICSEGLHNRLFEIINSFNHPQDLEDIISAIRSDIVNKAACEFAKRNDNHTYNRFFNVAHNEGLAVKTINRYDHGPVKHTNDTIKEQLAKTFIHHFRPFEILQRCHDYIISELVTQGYRGKLNEDSYQYQSYAGFVHTLQRLLNKTASTIDNTFLELDDHSNVIDIKWPNVTLELWRYFNQNGYFIYDKQQQLAFESFLNDQSGLEGILAGAFDSYNDLNNACQLAPHVPDTRKLNLFKAFKEKTNQFVDFKLFNRFLLDMNMPINSKTCETARQTFPKLNYKDQWPNLSLIQSIQHFKNTLELYSAITKISIFVDPKMHEQILTEADQNGNQILHLAAQKSTQALNLLLQLAQHNNPLKKAELLTSVNQPSNNPLMKAIKFNPKAAPLILNESRELAQKHQYTMLAQTNYFRYNALMLALRLKRKESLAFIQSIQRLTTEQQYNIFKHFNIYQNNSLMLAAKFYPPAFKQLIQAVNLLGKQQLSRIFDQHNYMDENVLTIAAKHNRQLVLPIMDSLSQLDSKQQNDVLEEAIDYMNTEPGQAGQALFPEILLASNKLIGHYRDIFDRCLLTACAENGTKWLRKRLFELSHDERKAGTLLQSLVDMNQYDELLIKLVHAHNALNEHSQPLQKLCQNPSAVDELISPNSSANKSRLFRLYRQNCAPRSFRNVLNKLCQKLNQTQMDLLFRHIGLPTTKVSNWFQKVHARLTNQKTLIENLELDRQIPTSPDLDQLINQYYPFWRQNGIAVENAYELEDKQQTLSG